MKPEWKSRCYAMHKANEPIRKIAKWVWGQQQRIQWVEYGISNVTAMKKYLIDYIECWE